MSHLDEGQLHELLDGELDDAARAAALAHLASCERCQAQYEEAAAFLAEADGLINAVQLPERPVALAESSVESQKSKVETESSTSDLRLSSNDQRRRRLTTYRALAWAASVVLAVGIGWYGSDLSRAGAKEESATLATTPTAADAPVPSPTPPASVATKPAEQTGALPDAAAGSTRTREPAPVVSPSQQRANTAQPAQSTGKVAPAAELAEKSSADLASDQRPRPPAAAPPPSAAALSGAAAPADTAPGNRLVPRDAVSAPRQAETDLAAAARTDKSVVPGFRRIEMEEAVRTLGGSIRLIDGITPERILTGPVPRTGIGDDLIPFIRVVYEDPPGRELWLDQKRSSAVRREERRTYGATALLPGDTLVNTESDGSRSLTWMDQSGFQLRLTGFLPADSLRLLRGRIR